MPSLRASQTQLIQLFQNLISNGIKFVPDGRSPQIHIAAQKQESDWVFEVHDNGIGIDAQHLKSIFELFQRLHTSEEYPGTGLGLAICRKIVELYGGKIWVESQPGIGSVFYFTLPA